MIEIGRLIDERGLSGLQIFVIVLCGLVVLLDGYDIQTMALAVPSLAVEWSLHPSRFGLTLAAALVGIAAGAAFVAPLGDRVGRRSVLGWSMLLVGVASAATATSGSLTELVAWRFLTGIGLGASLPNATALTSEYVPLRRRAALVTLMYVNVAVGAFTAGFVAPPIIDAFGWRGIFVAGGVFPIALALVIFGTAPESVRFLCNQRPGDPRIARILARIAPDVNPRDVHAMRGDTGRPGVSDLWTSEYRARTALLWCVYCLNLFVLFLLMSWLPTLLADAGWTREQASRGTAMIQAGGVIGGLVLAWCVDRGRAVGAIETVYALTAAALGLFIILPADGGSWWLLLLVIGGGASGGIFALNALAAAFYPPGIRATGVGWAVGFGRIGAITAPIAGGWIVRQSLLPGEVLGLLVVPVFLCGACVLMLPRVWRGT